MYSLNQKTSIFILKNRSSIIDEKIKFGDKDIQLKQLKLELNAAKLEILRFQNIVNMKFEGEITEFNRISESLKQKVETIQFQITELERVDQDQFHDKYKLVVNSWKELNTYLNTD